MKATAYRALDVITRGRGIAHVVRFPARWCRYYPAEFFTTSDLVSNANSVVMTAGSSGSFDVPSTTIDEIVDGLDRELSCVKLDIEGAELAALQGAEQATRRHRPALAIEVHARQLLDGGWSTGDLWAWLSDAGYDVSRNDTAVNE